MSIALTTDLYELRMAASYLRRRMHAPATFSMFVRGLPPNRGFLVTAGLEDVLRHLQRFSFAEEDLAWLAGQPGFRPADIGALASLRFTGEVWAVPEGRLIGGGTPLLEITAPIAEAQLAETLVLNQLTYQTAIASKAARCRIASAERIRLVDFALRRTHGLEAGLAVARVSAMVGFAATSNSEAARRHGLVAAGTMAHAYVEAFPDEPTAFAAFAEDYGAGTTFLVDTYDTLGGVARAIEVMKVRGPTLPWAVRLDSGDLTDLARRSRSMLDAAGLGHVEIFVSGGLDEGDLARFVEEGAPIDAAGVGTQLGVAADAPALDSAYKLVTYDARPVLKLSSGKATLPFAKQVHRARGDIADVVAERTERPPRGTDPLLERVMSDGRRTDAYDGSIGAARARFEADLGRLPPEARRLDDPVPVRVGVSAHLQRETARITADLRRGTARPRRSNPSEG